MSTDKLGAVVAQLAKDNDAVHVETQTLFDNAAKAVLPEHWIWDGVHLLPQPEKLQELVGKWQAWADRIGVQPWLFQLRAA